MVYRRLLFANRPRPRLKFDAPGKSRFIQSSGETPGVALRPVVIEHRLERAHKRRMVGVETGPGPRPEKRLTILHSPRSPQRM